MKRLAVVASTLSTLALVAAPASAQDYGGLAPPPPSSSPPPSGPGYAPASPNQPGAQPPPANTGTEHELKKSEEEDAGRGLEWVWLQLEGGLQQLNLETFKGSTADNRLFLGTQRSSSVGPMVGGAVGIRLVFITLGLRGRVAFLPDYDYFTIDPELGIHIPLGNLEPYFFVGGGYSALGGLSSGGTADFSVRGFNVRGGVGLDYYLSPHFSLGGLVTGEVTAMTRPGVTIPTSTAAAQQQAASNPNAVPAEVAAANGSGVGLGIAGTLVAGLHF